MVGRKAEKIAALLTAVVVICLAAGGVDDWHAVGIYAGCELRGRVLYPFFHTGMLHAVLNAWCWLGVVFIYDIRMWRLLAAYLIAVAVPAGAFGMTVPTVGLSGVVFALFGAISFEVARRWHYQAWMATYLAVGFLFPGTNAWLHLHCYAMGLLVALLNKPIKGRG